MRHLGERYRWGVVVAHNWDQIPGRGSCIFLHVWQAPNEGRPAARPCRRSRC
jgi:L,D-peptidoglycan transpeptidase YkuD (ErfK/YbiS/YcfS/YnhG family)